MVANPAGDPTDRMMSDDTASADRLERLTAALLRHVGSARTAGRNLVIGRPGMSESLLRGNGMAQTLVVGAGDAGIPGRLACRSHALPFQDQVFDHVVVHHVLRDGGEEEFAEARRVLRPGGHLIVIGLNGWSVRYWAQRHRQGALPGLQALRLCDRLESGRFRIEQCAGAGLAGLPWPGPWNQAPGGVPLPLADVLLVVARRHEARPVATQLRFGRPAVSGTHGAALERRGHRAAA